MKTERYLTKHDALTPSHQIACCALNEILFYDHDAYRLCHGFNAGNGADEAFCVFLHDPEKQLNPNSKVIISSMLYDTKISIEELYYYINLAYTRYAQTPTSQSFLNMFADGLDFFRKACDIKGTVHKEDRQPQ